MNFNSPANKIINMLENIGFEAYIVGGAVRDFLLGRESHDFDITTNALPNQIKKVFCDYKIAETGIKHGTVTVIVDKIAYEITTYRKDGNYLDNRHPSTVSFSNCLIDDLSRRDFTINALCYNEKTGIVDSFNGVNDLNNKIVKTVGSPEIRFLEDGLRILRALRFASELDFEIDNDTAIAINNCKNYLNNISVERIFIELTKLIVGVGAERVLSNFHEVLFVILPELRPMFAFEQKSLSHSFDVYHHTLRAISLNSDLKPEISWTLLLHDSGKPSTFIIGKDNYGHFPNHPISSVEIAKSVLNRLKAPNLIKNNILNLILMHDSHLPENEYDMKKLICKTSKEFMLDLFKVKYCDLYAHSEHGIEKYKGNYEVALNIYNKVIASGECYSLEMLNFNGSDAVKLGRKNKNIGLLLNNVLDLVMQNKIENNKDSIIKYILKNNL